jgi:hypothetical protein
LTAADIAHTRKSTDPKEPPADSTVTGDADVIWAPVPAVYEAAADEEVLRSEFDVGDDEDNISDIDEPVDDMPIPTGAESKAAAAGGKRKRILAAAREETAVTLEIEMMFQRYVTELNDIQNAGCNDGSKKTSELVKFICE